MKKGALIRTAVLAFALINQLLVLNGISPLPFSEEEVEHVFAGAFTVVASLITWWKNNSFTGEAIEADKYMRQLKDEKKQTK